MCSGYLWAFEAILTLFSQFEAFFFVQKRKKNVVYGPGSVFRVPWSTFQCPSSVVPRPLLRVLCSILTSCHPQFSDVGAFYCGLLYSVWVTDIKDPAFLLVSMIF